MREKYRKVTHKSQIPLSRMANFKSATILIDVMIYSDSFHVYIFNYEKRHHCTGRIHRTELIVHHFNRKLTVEFYKYEIVCFERYKYNIPSHHTKGMGPNAYTSPELR